MASAHSASTEVGVRDPNTNAPMPTRFSNQNPPQVIIRHPAYNTSRLIDLPAFDGGEDFPGLHHGTVLLICGIVAANRSDGWLSKTKGGDAITLGKDDLLPVGEYYFHLPWPPELRADVPAGVYKYSVVPTFRRWTFPHSNLPPAWRHSSYPSSAPQPIQITSRSSASQAVKARDGGCCISPGRDGVEGAHLIPEGEDDWFKEQEMDQYNPFPWMAGAKPVNNPANMLTLRADIHVVFDSKSFAFTWKQGSWVSHFLSSTANLGVEYHNMKVKMPADVNTNFILARLAWSVFPMIQNFFGRGESRLVRVALEEKEMTPPELRDLFSSRKRNESSMKSRSRSPQKKKRAGHDNEDADTIGKAQRFRLENDLHHEVLHADHSAAPITSIPTTPDLSACEAEPEDDLVPMLPSEQDSIKVHGWHSWIAALRQQALRDQRKRNASIMCCDYTKAEEAIAAGLEGPRMFGGAHVCMRCLGVEIVSDEVA